MDITRLQEMKAFPLRHPSVHLGDSQDMSHIGWLERPFGGDQGAIYVFSGLYGVEDGMVMGQHLRQIDARGKVEEE